MIEYIIIVLVCVGVFYRSLKYGVVVDDLNNRRKHDDPESERVRPLWLRLLRKVDGNYPVKSIFLDHILTLIVHTTVCLLMYKAFGVLEASLLFAVNVGNNQISIWMNGKRYGISTILCLLSFIYAPIGILFWFFTPFFQVNAITFPILLSLYKSWWLFLVLPIAFIMGGGYILKWAKQRRDRLENPEMITWRWGKLNMMAKTCAYYFLKGLIPYIPTLYPIPFKRIGLIDADTKEAYRFNIQALSGYLLVGFILYSYCIDKVFFFGLVWWLCSISIFSNWITLTVPLAERYMYLANVGLMLFFVKILSFIHPLAWTLVFVWYVSRLWSFMGMYKNMGRFLKHHEYHQPEDDQCWIFDANRFAEQNDINGIMYLANEGLVANPDSSWLWVHKAVGFSRMGYIDLAKQCIAQARHYSRDHFKNVVGHKIDEVEKLIKQGESHGGK